MAPRAPERGRCWDCDGFTSAAIPSAAPRARAAGAAAFDAGVTGLALLAFLGAGHDGRGPSPNDESRAEGPQLARREPGRRRLLRAARRHAAHVFARVRDDRDVRGRDLDRRTTWRRSAQAAVGFIERLPEPLQGLALRHAAGGQRLLGHRLDAAGVEGGQGRGARRRASARCGTGSRSSTRSPTGERAGPDISSEGELPVRPRARRAVAGGGERVAHRRRDVRAHLLRRRGRRPS